MSSRNLFKDILKAWSVLCSFTYFGKMFHSLGPFTAKELSYSDCALAWLYLDSLGTTALGPNLLLSENSTSRLLGTKD